MKEKSLVKKVKDMLEIVEGIGKARTKLIENPDLKKKKQQLQSVEFSANLSTRSTNDSESLMSPNKKTHFDFDDSAMVR